MNELQMLELINDFTNLSNKYSDYPNLAEFNITIQDKLCNAITEIGYSILNKEVFDDLFNEYMRYDEYGKNRNVKILNFLLNLTHIDINNDILNKYSLNNDNMDEVYNILQACKITVFKSLSLESDITWVYEREDILPTLLNNKILIENKYTQADSV